MTLLNDPAEQAKLTRLYRTFYIVAPLLIGVAYGVWGLDLAKGALIGSAVVGLNLFISQRFAAKVIFEKSAVPFALLVYVFKLGISILVLYIAINRFHIELLGIMIGLSSVVVAIFISTLGGSPQNQRAEEKEIND